MSKPAIIAAILPATAWECLHGRISNRRARCDHLWTSLAVMPVEIVFDTVEAELARRAVEP